MRDVKQAFCRWCDEETTHYAAPDTDVTIRWECENDDRHEYPWRCIE